MIRLLPMLMLLACARSKPSPSDAVRGEEFRQLQARVAALEQERQADATVQVAPQQASDPDPVTLRGLELRVQDLERRLVATQVAPTAETAGPAAIGLPTLRADPSTGVLVPVLNEEATVSCANELISTARNVEIAYDAAFDVFSEDAESVGWRPDAADPCYHYLAVAVEVKPTDFTVIAVITRGPGRGRQFQGGKQSGTRELARLGETGIATFLAGHTWLGSDR